MIQPYTPAIEYPESDGQPMAENTLQYLWIVTIKENLDTLCMGNPQGFVAADNFIYPVEGNPTIVTAPDVYVALGRPRHHRGSYKVWEENNIFPQVIFEILSPSNTKAESQRKYRFYNTYGAQEYYVYDPDHHVLEGWHRNPASNTLELVPHMHGWTSPLLGITFHTAGDDLLITHPDGSRFRTYQEVLLQARDEYRRAEHEAQRATQAEAELERMRALLRAAGMNPDATP